MLIRAMRDSNVPKFLAPDLPLFHAIVGDMFPGVVVPVQDTGDLEMAINECLERANLQRVDNLVTKILQVFDTSCVRFGLVLTGPTGSAKTTCYRTLAAAMTLLRERGNKDEKYQKVEMNVLNPKCITMGELYGEFNTLTQEWTDGLASTLIRTAVSFEDDDRRWTVFDGPIDALWIESMNTVLDDNLTLCLANGERIKLREQMRMVFEVNDLEVASPATVSRLGVVFMTPDDIRWQPFTRTWFVRELPPNMTSAVKDFLLELFLASVDDGLAFMRKNCTEPIATVDVQVVTSLCNLLLSLMKKHNVDWERPEADLKVILGNMFSFAYVWSVGGAIAIDGHEVFDEFMRGHRAFERVRFGAGKVFDVFVDKDGQFKKWADVVPEFVYNARTPYFQMVVPTVDTVRFAYLLDMQAAMLNGVFFTGVTGTGKTVIVQDFLNVHGAATYEAGPQVVAVNLNFSAQTQATDTQGSIEAKLLKKRKNLMGAPANKMVVVFVDDVNMPSVEEYGAQPPIELLRQFCDWKGFYDREKLFWKEIAETVLVCAAAPPGGGRAEITKRFTRHFHMLCVPPATDTTLAAIFGAILSGFFKTGFKPEVIDLVKPICQATTDIYNRIRIAMKPTPAKSHYTFNLRDVSKVIQGILMIEPKQCPTPDVAIKLWIHEAMRVFYDRLTTKDDQQWFANQCTEMSTRVFSRGWKHEDIFGPVPIMFCDCLRPRVDDGPPPYEEVTKIEKLVVLLNDALDDYNVSHPTQMKLVFFMDAVGHVMRIKRILRQPRGNAMLVGVGGSGKQSLTRMATAMSEMDCFQIELTRGYGVMEFREDIKKLMLVAGVEGKQIGFLFVDTQIVDESMLEDVNNILNTGEVPNLWASDELSKVNDDMRARATEAGVPETREAIYRFFVSRVRDNLHIVLAMSPVGNSLRVRCRQFPSLINCCTIDWFMPWPHDALLSVATRFFQEETFAEDDVKAKIAEQCVDLHLSVAAFSDGFFEELQRRVYTTPKSYLDLINLYLSMLTEKRDELSLLRRRLAIGVTKLEETNAMVGGLREELKKLQPVLDVKSRETAELLIRVRDDTEKADVVRTRVETDEAAVRKQADEVQVIQADAQADLDLAMPALDKALKALDSLSKADITEVKSFQQPPPAVRVVMEAVCILLGEKPDWDSAKKVLSNINFISLLREYDKDNIPAVRLKKVHQYIVDPMMAVDNVSKVSRAATSMCMWVHAMDVYSKVAKEVEPKKARLAEMNAKMAVSMAFLKEKQDELANVLANVAALQKKCEDTVNEKARLEKETQLTKDRLVRAERLTGGLADESVRWAAAVGEYDAMIRALVGDVLLSAACISYFGAFTGVYRERMVAHWLEAALARKIPCSKGYDLVRIMGSPVKTRDWQIQGLPTDAVSAASAILVTRGRRWPLMIDPQEQAKKWIRNMEAPNKLQTTRLTNVNMLRTLENCIRIGTPLLLEDIQEYLDPALEPVLARAVHVISGRKVIHLGDSDIDYDENFKLYMSTKMPNPHYLPEVCIKVTIINFTVTMEGLRDQLLGAVVVKERPDVEEKKNRLLVSMAADKRQLKDLEDKILKNLSESTGNILDDEVLINTLGESKILAGVIGDRLKESERTEAEINTLRGGYRPVALRGAIIYFVIADLGRIDPMYQYSLGYFMRLYNYCIDKSEKSDKLELRLESLMAFLTDSVYTNVCRGLFEAHKLLFSFLVYACGGFCAGLD